jgi:23S rRNA (adenine-N6)-dimethyltransferase
VGPALPDKPAKRRRVLGQNFFRSADAARRFASQLAGGDGAVIVEVGAGSGMITRVLAELDAPVLAVEMDPYWARSLKRARLPGVVVVREDFLHWTTPPAAKMKIIGNVPFGAGTKILRHCLDFGPQRLEQAVLLLQEDVVLKRVGRWGGNLFNIQWAPWYTFRAGMTFPRAEFRPVPDTDTATLLIEPRDPALLPWDKRHDYQGLVREVFSTGHLTLDVASRAVAGSSSKAWLARSGLDGKLRVKDLAVEDWVALHRARALPSGRRGSYDFANRPWPDRPRR